MQSVILVPYNLRKCDVVDAEGNILVDDFSTDNSVKLIEKYQKEDGRIILLKHKKNKGTFIPL